jgi:hypothetical protein
MKTRNHTMLKAVLGLVVLFLLINAGWFGWRMVKYDSYCRGWKKNPFATWIVPRYVYVDEEGYDYGVKYPDYLTFTGNMSVELPSADDNPFTDFLVVWPKVSGRVEYGVSLTKGSQVYQVYINADGTAVYPEDIKMVEEYQDTINDLLSRAKRMWDLD